MRAVTVLVSKVWNETNAEEEVLAMVVRTGLSTTMGDMLRQVMAPLNDTDSTRDPFVVVSCVVHICVAISDWSSCPHLKQSRTASVIHF